MAASLLLRRVTRTYGAASPPVLDGIDLTMRSTGSGSRRGPPSGRIEDEQEVGLPRPRDRDDPAFESAKRRLRSSLNGALAPARAARSLAS